MLVRFRLRVLELLRLNGSPHGIALGFTLGVALSLIPVPFLGMFVALALAPALRANLPATYFGTAIVNPVTGAPIYFSELWLGASLLDIEAPSWADAKGFDGGQWLALFGELLPAFGVGGLLVAFGTALVSYPLLRFVVRRFQARHPIDADEPSSR